MNVWQALLIGAVQGLTEFLPVSSSGHMLLVRKLCGIEAGMLFDVFMHLGTLLAVVVVFRKELLSVIRPPFGRLALIAFATLPAGVAGVLFSDEIERIFGGGEFLFLTFAASGAFVLITRAVVRRTEERGLTGRLGVAQAAAMGIAQAAALLPGLSRSGTVICAGVAAGSGREEAAAFAFMMSVPVVIGSALLGGMGGLHGGADPLPTLVGCASAFLTGIVSAKLALKTVGKSASIPIAIYLFGISFLSLILWHA